MSNTGTGTGSDIGDRGSGPATRAPPEVIERMHAHTESVVARICDAGGIVGVSLHNIVSRYTEASQLIALFLLIDNWGNKRRFGNLIFWVGKGSRGWPSDSHSIGFAHGTGLLNALNPRDTKVCGVIFYKGKSFRVQMDTDVDDLVDAVTSTTYHKTFLCRGCDYRVVGPCQQIVCRGCRWVGCLGCFGHRCRTVQELVDTTATMTPETMLQCPRGDCGAQFPVGAVRCAMLFDYGGTIRQTAEQSGMTTSHYTATLQRLYNMQQRNDGASPIRVCTFCGKPAPRRACKRMECPCILGSVYCGRKCQKKHWRIHKQYCTASTTIMHHATVIKILAAVVDRELERQVAGLPSTASSR